MEAGGYGTGERGCMENNESILPRRRENCAEKCEKMTIIVKVTKSVTFSCGCNEFSRNPVKQATL
jgi:hypothetical protein